MTPEDIRISHNGFHSNVKLGKKKRRARSKSEEAIMTLYYIGIVAKH